MRSAVFIISTLAMAAFVGALSATILPARASGGISCDAGGTGVTVAFGGGVTRGMGSPLFSFDGEASVKDNSVASDLQSVKFELANVAQYWLSGNELKLVLYREREGDKPHGYLTVTVETNAVDEGSYSGTYSLSTYDTTGAGEPKEYAADGAIECFVE